MNGLEEWLVGLSKEAALTPTARELLRAITQNPERASYATTRDIAATAQVDLSNVTRLAQALGFRGWPHMQEEIRTRYLKTLSLVQIAEQHEGRGAPSGIVRAIDADRRALNLLRPDPEAIGEIVSALAGARERIAIGTGTYAAPAHVLALHAGIAGYPMAHLDGPALVNALVRLGPDDILVAFGLWRPYATICSALALAKQRGATTVVITDAAHSPYTKNADHLVQVSSEGGAHFPTLVPTFAAVNFICSELAQLDTARTRDMLSRHEKVWDESGVFQPD
jgi:DNA-binding MurR/RpiR family transcriptional regulator